MNSWNPPENNIFKWPLLDIEVRIFNIFKTYMRLYMHVYIEIEIAVLEV